MNRTEIIDEIKALDGTAIFSNEKKTMKAIIKGKEFLFKFINKFDEEELIAVEYKKMIIFADKLKFRNDELFLEQNGCVVVAKMPE